MVAQVEIAVERHWYVRLVILDFSSIRIIEWHISSHHIKVEIWFLNTHIRMISQTCIYCRIMRKIFELYGWNGLRAFGPSARFIPSFDVFLSIDVFSTVQFKKKLSCYSAHSRRGSFALQMCWDARQVFCFHSSLNPIWSQRKHCHQRTNQPFWHNHPLICFHRLRYLIL